MEKHQLTRKRAKEQTNFTVEKGLILSLLLETIVGQPLRPAHLQPGQLIWKGTNSSEEEKKKLTILWAGSSATRLEHAQLIFWKRASSSGK